MAEVKLTQEQFNAAIAAAAEAGAKAALAAHASAASSDARAPRPSEDVAGMTDETFHAMLKDRRGQLRPPIPEERIEGCESTSGATFTAVIAHGKVKVLEEYKHPAGCETHMSEGGLVPDGFPIRDTNGKLEPKFKQWKWESFWQHDINEYVGKPLPAHVRASARKAAAV